MHPYAIAGTARRIAYLATVGVAVCGAAVAASLIGAWAVAPVFLLGYAAVFTLHERWCWHWWRPVHRVVNLTGCWRLGDDRLNIRQTWTRMQVAGCLNGVGIDSRMAEWRVDLEGLVLDVVAVCPDGKLAAYRLRHVADGTLTLLPRELALAGLFLTGGWQRDLPASPGQFPIRPS